MKIVCGKCSAECELPKDGTDIKCPACGAVFHMPSLAEGEQLLHPNAFPGYRLLAIIGHGGMGHVYRAIQLSMDREVAVKVLRKKYAALPRFVQRFAREATALAALNHPNIVAVIDRGQVGDTYYFVMEYVHGRTLRHLIRTNKLSVERSVEIAIQICQALEAAHGAGVVHRDIKPGNVLVEEDGLVKVADFGIARVLDEETAEGERRSRLGTAKYMAPEQKDIGETIDPRADLCALGITLFEMLTGNLPKQKPARGLNPLVPPALDEACARAMRQERDERFPSAADMRRALEDVLAALRHEPAAEAAAPPPLEVPQCPTCNEPVAPDQLRCPHCDAVLAERCFRDDCDGIHTVGAERCARCNGHVELLKHRRRLELEGRLKRAAAAADAGDLAAALEALQAVAADPHADFAHLREQAQATARPLRQRRRRSLLRTVLHTAAALLLVAAAGIASYTGVRRLVARTAPREPVEDIEPIPGTDGEPHPPATKAPVGKAPPARTRRPLREYLVALTATTWADYPPSLRIRAVADAAQCLGGPLAGSREGQRLVQTLDALKLGNLRAPQRPRVLRLLEGTLDTVAHLLADELRRHRALAGQADHILKLYADGRQKSRSSIRRLELAAATLTELLAAAEAEHPTKPDLPGRLLLLDAAVAMPDRRRADLHPVAAQLVRAGRLLIRHQRRQAPAAAAPELLDDAARRLDVALRESADYSRLAYSVEAIVEALAARNGAY